MNWFLLIFLAFFQTVAFAMVSRARNRDNLWYHAATSVASNAIWFATIGILVVADFDWILFMPYLLGTVSGSLFGAKVSMWIEEKIGAKT